MATANWDASYATGYMPVDLQHQKLFDMVNELHEAIVAGTAKEKMMPTVRALAKYTVEHFRTEETLMEKLNYPETAAHKAAHAELITNVTELIAGVESGKATLPLTLGRFLADWITHHIKGNDLQLIRWVRSQTGFVG